MEHKKKIKKYYAYGLVPILVLWALISVFISHVYGVFFLIGYTWPYMYYTPGFEERAQSKSYKYSFLGNLFKFQSYLFGLIPENPPFWMRPVARLVIPFLISGLLSILNPDWSPLWTAFGWCLFEGFVFCNKKYNWDLI